MYWEIVLSVMSLLLVDSGLYWWRDLLRFNAELVSSLLNYAPSFLLSLLKLLC